MVIGVGVDSVTCTAVVRSVGTNSGEPLSSLGPPLVCWGADCEVTGGAVVALLSRATEALFVVCVGG